MWVMHPDQIHLKCHLDFHSSCSQSPCWAGKRKTHIIWAVSFKCTRHGNAQRKVVKCGVFLLFCVVYPPWNRSNEELLPALPGEVGWDWTANDWTAGAVFWGYARWRKVIAASRTYQNPKLASARAHECVQRVWSLVLATALLVSEVQLWASRKRRRNVLWCGFCSGESPASLHTSQGS